MQIKINGKTYALLSEKQSESQNGTDIILVHGHNEATPFVVWRLYQDGTVEHGQYAANIYRAISLFEDRD